MKILAVISSPRGKGSGHSIVRKIENRMKALGDVKFTYLFLKDVDLRPCLGCYMCMAKGENKCPLTDDRSVIEQKLMEVDGVILSTPVYVNNVSGLMKNFIDRFAYLNHRPRYFRLKVLNVANMAGTDRKDTFKALKYALGGARGDRIVHELGIATPPWPQTERAVAKKERAIDAAAKKFYQACQDTSLASPTLKSYVDFLLMQTLYFECRQYLPADNAFYRDKTYYFDTHVNPIKSIAAKLIVKVVIRIMKEIGPGNVAWPEANRKG